MPVPRIGIAIVRGRSMSPTVHEGDWLLVAHGGRARPGRLAVVRFDDGVVAVKRLDHATDEGWWVSRDNPHEGRDSWSAGAVRDGEVLAIVLARLWPRPAFMVASVRHG